MKKLGAKAYEEIRTWIYCNARPLDLALWQFYFEGGDRETVVERLKFYQNDDGGFGHGLEPDCWNTESSPYATLVAGEILRDIGFSDMEHPVMRGILRFLESGAHSSQEGWLFSIPSNDGCPHAPWWSFSGEDNAVQGVGITATLCAWILHCKDQESKAFAKACGYVDRILERAAALEDFGEMGVGGLCILAQEIEACGLASRFDCRSIKERVTELANTSIERDPEKWALYTIRPSEVIPSPQSAFYPGNEEIVDKELDYLVETRKPGGVWDITWTWFQLGEQYAKEFAISENWWKANKAIGNLRFLRNFDRI